MTGFDCAGSAVAWAWQVLARPIVDRGGSALQFTVAASIVVAARMVNAIASGVADSIELVASKKLRAMGARYDAEIEQAKAQVNHGREDQLAEVRFRKELAEVRIKEAEANCAEAESALEVAKLTTKAVREEAALLEARAKVTRIRCGVEAENCAALAEAFQHVCDTGSKIKQGGGLAAFSETNLRQILAMMSTLPEPMRSEIMRKLNQLPDAERKSDGGDESESDAGE